MKIFNHKEKSDSMPANQSDDFILPIYLNQRFVYDILAVKNEGFTEFYEVKDENRINNNSSSNLNASLGNNNDFALIKAEVSGNLGISMYGNKSNEKTYKKTHTPTSLFMQVYNYLNINNKIIRIKTIHDLEKIKSGDFVEVKSSIELNTIVEFFETLNKVIDINDAIAGLASSSPETVIKSSISHLKKPVENILKTIKEENNDVKYGICKIDEKEIVVKLDRNFFINSDYSEIKNGEFRIIGKVLEIIPEGKTASLNRDNAIGIYDSKLFAPVKESLVNIPNIHFDEFQDEVNGKTCIIMPIAIGI